MGEAGTRDIALWQGTYPMCEAQSSTPRTIKQVYLKEKNYFCKLLSSLRAIKMILENKRINKQRPKREEQKMRPVVY